MVAGLAGSTLQAATVTMQPAQATSLRSGIVITPHRHVEELGVVVVLLRMLDVLAVRLHQEGGHLGLLGASVAVILTPVQEQGAPQGPALIPVLHVEVVLVLEAVQRLNDVMTSAVKLLMEGGVLGLAANAAVTSTQGQERVLHPEHVTVLFPAVEERIVLEGLLKQTDVIVNAVKRLTEGGVTGLLGASVAVISTLEQV